MMSFGPLFFTLLVLKKQGINLLWGLLFCFVKDFIYFHGQTSNANIGCQISMRNLLLWYWLTIVQAACGVKRAGSHKCIQRSLFRSSSSPQLQCKVYSRTAPAPGKHTQIYKQSLIEEGRIEETIVGRAKWSHANQILNGSNKGGAKAALIQVFGITQIYEFMDKLEENRK